MLASIRFSGDGPENANREGGVSKAESQAEKWTSSLKGKSHTTSRRSSSAEATRASSGLSGTSSYSVLGM